MHWNITLITFVKFVFVSVQEKNMCMLPVQLQPVSLGTQDWLRRAWQISLKGVINKINWGWVGGGHYSLTSQTYSFLMHVPVGLTDCKMCLTGRNKEKMSFTSQTFLFLPLSAVSFSCAGCIWMWMTLHYTVNWGILRMSQPTSLLEDELFLRILFRRWLKDKVLF